MTKVATETQPFLSHARPNHPPPALLYPRAGQRPAIHQCMPPEQMVHCLIYPRAGQRANNLSWVTSERTIVECEDDGDPWCKQGR
ncbi:hypothetical protein BCR44DRAFT_1449564 [Catenaria anguillulae PL171]|uniref:Uncharacterized protein n=1 Tax=Catenaria anguillulae PL171 TaxID=765915 RepID=A0A1Y2H4U4_9FUNG|nr:hypothetical protein BCR44DRAFT_1449564 [Catenaria anguillulae PL171]